MPKKNKTPRIPTCHPERKHLARGLCKQCYDADWQRRNRERRNATQRAWSAKNPERRLATRRKYLYGITPDVVQARLNAQDDLGAICRIAPATDLDHNHKTNSPRGLLCGDCNRALGLFREDPERLANAAFYLSLWDESKLVGI